MVNLALYEKYKKIRSDSPYFSASTAWRVLSARTKLDMRQRLQKWPSAREILSDCSVVICGRIVRLRTRVADYYDDDNDYCSCKTQYIEHGVDRNSDSFCDDIRRSGWSGGRVDVYTFTYTRKERQRYASSQGAARGPAWLNAWQSFCADRDLYLAELRGSKHRVFIEASIDGDDEFSDQSESDIEDDDYDELRSQAYSCLESAAFYLRSKEEP